MNGVHDMGGMDGFGPVAPDPAEPLFHAPWERRMLALTLAMGARGQWNIDMSRFARESMPPADYLAASYYQRWLYGLERLAVAHGLLRPGEVEARMAPGAPRAPDATPLDAAALRGERVWDTLSRGSSAQRDAVGPARFRPGDGVMTRNCHPSGHTRLPRYARGRPGVVERDYGVFIFPDRHAENGDPAPQHLYSVRFTAQTLWGVDASPRDTVLLDLWDDYLDPVDGP
ncbi:MAG: nitrile hydratase subunit beta [Candidatus Competibacterales bacterium]